MVGQKPFFRLAEPSVVCPAVGFLSQSTFGTLPMFGRPAGFKSRAQRPAFQKFPGKHFKKNATQKRNAACIPEIDLTKPWVNDEIKNEDIKKKEIVELWKKTKSVENWVKYEAQKLTVQTLYDKARAEYAVRHPDMAVLWGHTSDIKNYFCETCDKSFRTSDNFLLHEAEHETCGREGCEFTAHPKLVAKHIKMQHDTGLYKRIGKLYTNEDIGKWIEERKRRYPTRKLVEEKKLLNQEKLKRGEKINEDNSKFNMSYSNKRKVMRKKNFEKRTQKNSRTRHIRKKKNVSLVERFLTEETSATRKGVPAFLGIKTAPEPAIPDNNDLEISDEEWETENKPQITAKPLLNNSLGLLAMSYDSDEEDDKEKLHMDTNTGAISVDEGSSPEEVSSKNPVPEQKFNSEKASCKRRFSDKKHHRERRRKNISYDSHHEIRSVTLLEKLLKNEIKHERNVMLQCIHYIVKNNFFKT